MIYGYARVSTATQGRDGNSLEEQVSALEKYGWSHTSPSDELLDFVLENELTDILINRNEFCGFRVTGTGAHSGTEITPTKTSSTRKYICPCCGMSVRATRTVRIACMDCDTPLILLV